MNKQNDEINIKERFLLDGHLALVTGSARGIGRAIAIALAECGATVIVHGVKPSENLESALKAVRKFNPDCFSVFGDLSDSSSVGQIIKTISEKGELPDIVVANASLQYRTKWFEISLEEAKEQMQVNFYSTLALMQACYPTMKAKSFGRIVTIGSVQEFRPHQDMAIYAASKSAQENLVRNVAKQVAQFGITVNNVSPGVFATDRNEEALSNPDYAKRIIECIPSHKYAEPADAVGAVILLCSESGRYITGSSIVIDGGLRLGS